MKTGSNNSGDWLEIGPNRAADVDLNMGGGLPLGHDLDRAFELIAGAELHDEPPLRVGPPSSPSARGLSSRPVRTPAAR